MINEDELMQEVDGNSAVEILKRLGIKTQLDLAMIETDICTFKVTFIPNRWEHFENFLSITNGSWVKVKYFTSNGEKNPELARIPNDKGGIYIYYIEPEGVPVDHYSCIMYVGRAHYGEGTQNLRKRINSYESESEDLYRGRIKIRQLFNIYKNYLHVMYITIDGNDKIDKLEKELTTAIVPPVNSDLFQKTLKDARNMF